jgi:hypothetical protein
MIPCVRPISLTSNGVFEASQDSGSEEEDAMRTLIRSTIVMALALLTSAPVMAAQDMRHAKTTLTGAAEVPGPGDPQGSGTLQLTPIPTQAKCVMS